MSNNEHWEAVYASKLPSSVSWYRPRLERSLAWIEQCAPDREAPILDVGGGASTLVDALLELGYTNIAVADLSSHALTHARERLGERSESVRWIVGDVTTPLVDAQSCDVWHDRAVFHFLTQPEPVARYVEQLSRALRPGGHAIVATFAPDGPERCSGLPIRRYSAEELAAVLGEDLELIEDANEVHITPSGSPQSFTYALLRRRGAG